MNISNVGQNVSFINGASGNKLPTGGSDPQPTTPQKPEDQRSIDLRNVTRGEVNELIKSGFDDLLFVNPMKAVFDEDGNYAANGGFLPNEKFDLIGEIQGMIDYKKSIGESTEVLQEALGKYLDIHGQPFPKGVDVEV